MCVQHYEPLLDGVVLHCLGDTSSLLQLLEVLCGPTGGLQASSGLLRWSIWPTGFFPEGDGEQLFWAMMHPLAAELVLPHEGRMPLLLTGGICVFWGEMEDQLLLRSKRPVFFYPALRAPSCSLWDCPVAGVVWMVSRVCLAVTAVVREGEGWPLLGRERQDATHGKEGGNCKPKSVSHSGWG